MKEENVFDMYFATLVGMSEHPGYNRENAKRPTIYECAEKAKKMLEVRKCLYSQQQF
jgi:hypothetical protein